MNPSILRDHEALLTTVSSPKLDLVLLAWDHISERYIARLRPNREFAGRVRSIRLLAVHDAIQSVIDPGNGRLFKEPSHGIATEAAIAAAVSASAGILRHVFTDAKDRQDIEDLLFESLGLIGRPGEKEAGLVSGTRSAAVYLETFASLLVRPPASARGPILVPAPREPALAGASGRGW